jgi:uncharacterized protein (TIGR02246 family)
MFVLGCAHQNAATARRAPGRAGVREEVARILDAQVKAWNRGDIEGFMEHYWKSDELTFNSGGKTIHGWSATLDRYKQRYAPPEKMGRLRFDIDLVRPLGETAALVLGRWHLKINDQAPHGNFSLVFERIDNRWCITHDHTSLVPTPESPTADSE